MKKGIALLLVLSMIALLCACGKSDEAKHADETIAAIGEVNLESLSQIERAEKEVDSLSEKDVKSLDNLETLYEARAQYNSLSAKKVEAIIAAIGELDFDSELKIKAARDAYNSETKEIQELVGNYELLIQAEKDLPAVKVDIVTKEIEELVAMPVESLDSYDAFMNGLDSVNTKLKKLSESELALVANYGELNSKCDDVAVIRAQSALQDVALRFKIIYSHLELYIDFVNPNEKTIKYIDWDILFVNAVGDNMHKKGYSELYGCSDTGPYEQGKGRYGNDSCWKFYSTSLNIYDVETAKLGRVEIEYIDGTKVVIDNPKALEAVMK